METRDQLPNQARIYGWTWAAICPLLVAMALISTVGSDVVYRVQLVAFGAVSSLGLVAATGVIRNRVWGAKILIVLSWLGCVLHFGAALAAVAFAASSGKGAFVETSVVALVIAAPGVAFLFLARGLTRHLGAARGAV